MHQSNHYIKRKLGLWRAQKCIPPVGARSALTSADPQNTPTHVRQYRAENGILWKSGVTFPHGAVFAPKESLHHKEARAIESPKMYSPRRCNKRTYLCGYVNYPDSCKAIQGRERNIGEIRGYLSPWCSVGTQAMIISKGIWGYEEPKIYFSRRCNKRTYLCGSVNYPESCKAVQIRERNIGKILGYLSPWCSVCTHPLLISKEARVMESPKMYSSR